MVFAATSLVISLSLSGSLPDLELCCAVTSWLSPPFLTYISLTKTKVIAGAPLPGWTQAGVPR